MELDVHNTTLNDLRILAEEQGRLGYSAITLEDGTSGQVHFRNAGTKGRSGVVDEKARSWNNDVPGETRKREDAMIASLFEGLPTVKRRTAQERFEVLFERLVETGLTSYRKYGYPVWPRSIQAKLTELGWKEFDPNVYGQCSALARQLFIESGHKQEEKDQRKVTLNWSGHYNHK